MVFSTVSLKGRISLQIGLIACIDKLLETTENGSLTWSPYLLEGLSVSEGYTANDGLGHVFKIYPAGSLYVREEPDGLWQPVGNSAMLLAAIRKQSKTVIAIEQPYAGRTKTERKTMVRILYDLSKL